MNSSANRPPDICRSVARVDADLVRAAAQFQAAILADVNDRRGTLHGRIQGLSPAMTVAGPALTVEVRPGDNLMIHAAIALAQPGDVIVVDGKADQTCALIGEIMATQAQARGVAGFVIDAAVRDAEALRAKGYPVFAVGTNPCGPSKRISGRVNWPVSVGGVGINPGDLIVGDADGVVVIERGKVAAIVELAKKKLADENARLAGIAQGKLTASWLQDALRSAGALADGEVL